MPEIVDLSPAARQMVAVLRGIDNDQLTARTPCEPSTIGDLVDHVDGLAQAFAAAAAKQTGAVTASPPAPDASRLGTDWRTRIPPRLDALAAAWTDPDAWQGMTEVGGVTLPGGIAGQVALNELVLHGWDIARASGQEYDIDPDTLHASWEAVSAMYPAHEPERRRGIFGPPVSVPDGAPLFHRLLGLSGRDPAWA